MDASPIYHETFPAMGTEIEIVLVEAWHDQGLWAAQVARQLAEEWEVIFSRFRVDSELSWLNARSGAITRVSPMLLHAIRQATQAYLDTDGYFNPLVLPRLIELGYRHTFKEIDTTSDMQAGHNSGRILAADLIKIDVTSQTIALPAGSAIDLGGIAKGMYVDTLVSMLSESPAGIVSAGGDMRVWGKPPGNDRWTISVEDPARPGTDLFDIVLEDGAIATSGANRRSWQCGIVSAHHLIDPFAGKPAISPAQSISVVAKTAETADTLATALFVSGPSLASMLSQLHPSFALVITLTDDGEIQVTEGGVVLDVKSHETSANPI